MENRQGKSEKRHSCISNTLRSTLRWGGSLLLALALVLLVREYGIASYQVSTNAMNEALDSGDYILVNKLPLKDNPGRNRALLFHSPLQKDSLSRPLFLSRCIGMPGDTIKVDNDGYMINGRRIPHSPRALVTYFITASQSDALVKVVRKLNIPVRNWKKEDFGFSLSLTSFEEYQIREELDEVTSLCFVRNRITPYQIVVPRKDRHYRLDPYALTACKEAVMKEVGDKAQIKDGKLYIDGVETRFFYFTQDYYWVLSDNINESVDSRHLGFIPRDEVVGNAFFCWFSRNRQHLFKSIK